MQDEGTVKAMPVPTREWACAYHEGPLFTGGMQRLHVSSFNGTISHRAFKGWEGRSTVRIDLVTLKVFISVFENESLAKAAEREHLAPSAVSKRLTDLEHHLKVNLFDRKHAGMFPTAAGTALMHHARKVMRDISQLETEMFEYSKGLRGVIRIYANTSAMVQYLPGELSSFLRHHPLVRIDLEEATSPETLRAVEENNAEIGRASCRERV